MRMRDGVLATGLLVICAGAASAQVRTTVRAQTVYESYTFDPGFNFDKVTEFSVPVGIDLAFGTRANLTLSSGYVSLDVSPDADYARVSGMMNTELRLGVNVIPGRLIAVATGRLPTGVKVNSEQAAVLTPISSDVIGFAVPTLGMGSSLGGGFVGALPAGKFAIGLGATYSYPFSYQPYADAGTELAPGAEFRVRLGVEGPLARTTYMRVAGVFAARAKDQLDGATQSGVGPRVVGYGEIAQGIGRMQLRLYAFDVYRGSPSIVGPAILPKGNLIVAGFRHAVPVTRSFSVAPRAEWRMSTAAPVTSYAADGETPVSFGSLKKVGSSFRIGIDASQTFTPGFSVSLYGSGLFGDVRPTGGSDIPLKGWRAGFILNFTP